MRAAIAAQRGGDELTAYDAAYRKSWVHDELKIVRNVLDFPLRSIADNADRKPCDAFFQDVFGAQSVFEMLVTPEAEAIVAEGRADAVAIARGILYDPHWPWHAAAALGAQVVAPRQYWRSQPRGMAGLFGDVTIGMR